MYVSNKLVWQLASKPRVSRVKLFTACIALQHVKLNGPCQWMIQTYSGTSSKYFAAQWQITPFFATSLFQWQMLWRKIQNSWWHLFSPPSHDLGNCFIRWDLTKMSGGTPDVCDTKCLHRKFLNSISCFENFFGNPWPNLEIKFVQWADYLISSNRESGLMKNQKGSVSLYSSMTLRWKIRS